MLRRKQYEEEKLRIEEEYQRELVRIDEEFRQAARKIELKFAARRGEVKKQFGDEKGATSSTTEQPPVGVSSTSPSVCTTSPNKLINRQSSYERQQNDALPERCSVAVNVSRGITVAADSNEEKKCACLWHPFSTNLVGYKFECKPQGIQKNVCNLEHNK